MANHQDNFAQNIAQSEHTSSLPEPVWLLGEGGTYGEALSLGQDIRQEALRVIHSLPRKDVTKYYPSTMSDAISLVHARDDAKKKAGITKSTKIKQRSLGASLLGSDNCFPGAVEGGGDQYAFWMYLEDCFRDVTQEDLHDIIPLFFTPNEDPAFAMSAPGSGKDLALKIGPLPGGKKHGAKHKSAVTPSPLPIETGQLNQQQWQEKIDVAATEDASHPMIKNEALATGDGANLSERRSRRLGSKPNRSSSYAFDDDDDMDFVMEQEEIEIKEAIAMAEAAAASIAGAEMTPATTKADVTKPYQHATSNVKGVQPAYVPVVTTPHGTVATILMDTLDDRTFSRLALQLYKLQKIVMVEGGDRREPRSLDAKAVKSLSACVSSNGSSSATPVLGTAVRSAVQSWLESQSAALSDALGCKTSVLVLPSRKGDGATASPHQKKEQEGGGGGVLVQETTTNNNNNNKVGHPMTASAPSSTYHHPYTALIMKNVVAEHICQQAVDPLPSDPQQVTISKTPTLANLLGLSGAPSTAAVSSAGVHDADTSTFATPAASGMTSTQHQHNGDQATEEMNGGIGGAEDSQVDSGVSGGRHAGGRQRAVSNYALLAGKKDPAKAAAAAAARKLSKEAAAVLEAQVASQHPVARAVAIAVAEGEEEGPMDVQWDVATRDMGLLAAAPQDEIAAEMLALQAELASVAAVNRMRLVPAVCAMLKDLSQQHAAAEVRLKEEQYIKSWVMGMREARRKEIKQRREAAQRELISGAPQGSDIMAGAVPFHHALDTQDEEEQMPFLGPDELFDAFAQRKEDDEAFCAVCGDGSSIEPNVILFCDRCDIAVHQRCYDVDIVPETEWLCWPCKEHEASLLAQGVPQSEIRKPHMMPEDRKKLTGGARDATCTLCPIKLGAFRRTGDGSRWVHQACALWHPESYMLPGNGPNVVEGLNKIPQKRWTTPCDICGRSEGAVINCKHPGTCQYSFHVLCARTCGLYLTVRKDLANKLQYRIYCPMHSKAQREKDRLAYITAQHDMQNAASKNAKKKAEEVQRQLVIDQIRSREAERNVLASIRDQTERLRVLLDQCKRREKLKKQLIQATSIAHAERMTYPEEALQFLGKMDVLEKKGLSPEHIMQQIMDLNVIMDGTITAAAATVPMTQQHPGIPSATPSSAHNPNISNKHIDGGVAVPIQQIGSISVPDFTGPTLLEQRRAHGEIDTSIGGVPVSSPAVTAVKAVSGGSSIPSTKRKRDTAAEQGAPMSVPALAVQQVKKQRSTGHADHEVIERQKVMSSAEAAEWNKKFPPEIRYVLADQLAGATTPRQARAAARAAGHETPKQQEEEKEMEGGPQKDNDDDDDDLTVTRTSSRTRRTKE